VYIGSNEGFPSVNNGMRRTETVPAVFYSLWVRASRRSAIRSVEQGIFLVTQQDEQGEALVGALLSGYKPNACLH